MRSIKTKLVFATTTLIVAIMAIAAVLLIQQKERELTGDLFRNTNSFAELTATDVVEYYNLFLAENSFVYFNREIQRVFRQNPDISFIKIIRFNGEILYDSETDVDEEYSGALRRVDDDGLKHVQSQFASAKILQTGRSIFMKRTDEGDIVFIDENEKPIAPLAETDRVHSLLYPVDNAFAVMYGVSYDQLDERVGIMRNNIILLAAFAVMIGFGVFWFIAGGITRPLKKMVGVAHKIGLGDFKSRIEVKTNDETALLGTTINQMAQTLEITTKAIVYEERVKKELELAAQIQKDILPKSVPQVRGLDVSAGLLPAEEIGGDCYDFIKVGDSSWMFYLGDVTGHGVPSGIVVSIANAMFFRSSENEDPKEILVDVNRVLKEKTTANMFLTLVLLKWDEETQTMTYVSAGHEPMMHYRAATNDVVDCPHGGIALGMVPNIAPQLQVNQVHLEPGDFLVLYSDGIPEAWRNEKEMYGMDRFKNIVKACGSLERASAIRNTIFADVKQFTGEFKQMDDITTMVIKKL